MATKSFYDSRPERVLEGIKVGNWIDHWKGIKLRIGTAAGRFLRQQAGSATRRFQDSGKG